MKSISNQVLASIILSLGIIFGGWLFYRIHNRMNYETKRIYEIQVRNTQQIANYLSYPMQVNKKSVVVDNLKYEVSDKYVTAVKVFDAKGKLYACVFSKANDSHSASMKKN